MTDADFPPTLYLKQGCPFCFKVRLFLLEAGLTDRVTVRDFTPGTPEEDAFRAELAPHLGKISYPAAELAPGHFVADSDAIVADLAAANGIDPTALPLLRHYVDGPFTQIGTLWRENQSLKATAA